MTCQQSAANGDWRGSASAEGIVDTTSEWNSKHSCVRVISFCVCVWPWKFFKSSAVFLPLSLKFLTGKEIMTNALEGEEKEKQAFLMEVCHVPTSLYHFSAVILDISQFAALDLCQDIREFITPRYSVIVIFFSEER